MKKSNKILLGGFLVPIILFLGIFIFFTVKGTNDPNYQLGNNHNFNFNVAPNF
ncbi:MAG: hypothetical protein JXR64_06505 [Spirochaetales bacterium]|nr:hypothetical protein [Spirochaetales bacterium]